MSTVERREFLRLAKPYKPKKHNVHGWFLSEKLDGQRCLWDGGVTRGMALKDVPFANLSNTHRLISEATGLWSRYGNVMRAPEFFLDLLPHNICLDGELYLAPGCFQETRSIGSK